MKRTKPWKVAGVDEVCLEKLRTNIEDTASRLTTCYKRLWENERWPKVWKKGRVVGVFQKADLHDCNNGRGMTSLPATSKIFLRMLFGGSRKA